MIRSDDTWTSRRSPIVRADLMDGQTVDFAAGEGSPTPCAWGRSMPPRSTGRLRRPCGWSRSRAPRSVREIEPGVWVVDFGQNASGWIRLSDLGPEGTAHHDRLRRARRHRRRPLYGPPRLRATGRTGDGVPCSATRSSPDAQGEVFEPRHTVHGFQYARLTRHGAPLDPASITMQIVHTDLRRTGTFACSDDDLNRLHEIADWSFRGNAVDVPTDCPTRERLAWTGDYQIFAPTATRLYDVLGLQPQVAAVGARRPARRRPHRELLAGRPPHQAPPRRPVRDDDRLRRLGRRDRRRAVGAVRVLRRRAGALAENWDAMVRWVEWALEKARTERHHARAQNRDAEPFEQYLWDGTFHWGEWTEPKERDADGTPIDPIKHNPMAWFMADKGEVGTAYLYRSTATLSRVASVLGHDDAAARYGRIAEQVARRMAGRVPARRRHHGRRHAGRLRARAVVRPDSGTR